MVRFYMMALDRALVPGRQAHSCMVLDQLPPLVVLGMPFLANTNPTIDW